MIGAIMKEPIAQIILASVERVVPLRSQMMKKAISKNIRSMTRIWATNISRNHMGIPGLLPLGPAEIMEIMNAMKNRR